jgi:hypothetical protein
MRYQTGQPEDADKEKISAAARSFWRYAVMVYYPATG